MHKTLGADLQSLPITAVIIRSIAYKAQAILTCYRQTDAFHQAGPTACHTRIIWLRTSEEERSTVCSINLLCVACVSLAAGRCPAGGPGHLKLKFQHGSWICLFEYLAFFEVAWRHGYVWMQVCT